MEGSKVKTTIRVANIIEEARLGGPQLRILSVAKALAKKIETIVIMPKENSDLFQEACKENEVKYISLPLNRITREVKPALRYLIFFPYEIIYLFYTFKKANIDLVHVSGGAWQIKGVVAGRLAGCKVLWHLNDTSMPKFVLLMFKLFSPFCNAIVYASERSREYYGPIAPVSKKKFVVPAPVNTKLFDPDGTYDRDKAAHIMGSKKIVVGTVANINPIKGFDTLIHAASIVAKKRDDILFVVVGPVYKNQQRFAETLSKLKVELGLNNVHFLGRRKDARALLKRFDIYVCSSHAESSPLSVWEAMSMGKAIISTDVGDVSRYVKHGEAGEIVPIADQHALAAAVLALAENPGKRARYGACAKSIAISQLDLALCAQRHESAYISTMSCT